MEVDGRREPLYLTLNQTDDGVSATAVYYQRHEAGDNQNAELRDDELVFEIHDNVADRHNQT